MFQPVSSRVSFPEIDKRVLQLWKDRDVFRRTETEREDGPLFMLYEGPPTANGSPGVHHVLARVFKDIICRYKTMKGYRCVRKGGWDTHGLPVELEVEKELGLGSKRDIEEYGIEEFNRRCRESVFRYVKEWESMTDRIGFWVDMDDPYVTLDNSYIETGWWILRQLWDRGLLYQDIKGTPHCPRCVTSLSSHEVALGYRENTPDPSVYVKFRVSPSPSTEGGRDWGETPTYLLAWTTTPWTLPGNTALAVAEDAEYSVVEVEGAKGPERLVMAAALLETALQGPYDVVTTLRGSDLVGLRYQPLYDPQLAGVEVRRFQKRPADGPGPVGAPEPADQVDHRAVSTDFVSLDDGTGIVHIAPAFGDEDLSAGREHGLGFVQSVDLQGVVTGGYPFSGKFVKEADEEIMADLESRGLLYHRGVYRHTYPFCWRCDAPLLYYAKTSWYIRTTAEKEGLVDGNRRINWYPGYIRDGRFGEWLANNVDWAISRERYWGTPIPLWQCASCGHCHCVGSVAELKDMAVPEHRDMVDGLDLHRPYVDAVSIRCPQCGGRMARIPEVMDAWFDSGAMPFAQYATGSDDDVSRLQEQGRLPADYICEAVDQTRGWFYSLHALSVLLTGQPSYRNVICLGHIQDGRGRKMSKSLGNVVDPWTVLDAQGADAVRWYLFTASHPGESRRFSEKLVNEVVRRHLLTLWNVYSFFTTYASVDRFHPDQVPDGWTPSSELDRWLLSELNTLVPQVDDLLAGYEPTDAGRRIQEFVDRLSNWYVRRSRRRFWKSENDEDKLSAYATLYTCLTALCKLIAPFTPFMAEEIYQNLVASVDPGAAESVHLAPFPTAALTLVDETLMEATRLAMRVSSMGRGARSRAGLKVRQPLSRVVVIPRNEDEERHIVEVRTQILEELNIKELEIAAGPSDGDAGDGLYRRALEAAGGGEARADEGALQAGAIVNVDPYWVSIEGGYMVAIDSTITSELADEGLARELVHRVQSLRRGAGFDITDRIVIYCQGPEPVQDVGDRFADYIQQETLSEGLVYAEPADGAHAETQVLEGMEVVLGVKRV
ncbi:MAG: isoleucine--tRNA ligase [Dehalococcoidia bacterium]|nr:isoleucine--tRNA ligase [Dehalococcoidia bacterium]